MKNPPFYTAICAVATVTAPRVFWIFSSSSRRFASRIVYAVKKRGSQMKRILSLCLASVLCLGLGLPAFAAVDWDDFYLVTQPPEKLQVPFGTPFTVEIKVNAPQGAELTYQWGQVIDSGFYPYKMEDATQPVFQCFPGDYAYPNAPAARPYLDQTQEYACKILATEKDAEGDVLSQNTRLTQRVSVTVLRQREASKWEAFSDRWVYNPLFATVALCIGS
jgi:hypothetical protein